MNIANIQTFLYIVRYQSISKAASALFISQPTASSRLKQLEHELGVTLMDREKGEREVRLTAKGSAFVPLAESWLDLDRSTMLFSGENTRELVKVVAPTSMNLHVLSHVFNRVLQNDPTLQPQMIAANSQMVYTVVGNREADVGFAYRTGQYANTVATPVYKEDNIILCYGGDAWPDRPIHPSELDPRCEVAVASWTGEARRWHDAQWSPYSAPYIQVDSSCHVAAFLNVPGAWAVCPISIAKSFQAQGYNVLIRPFAIAPAEHVCYLVTSRDRHRRDADAVNRLTQAMYAYIDETPWLTRM